MVVSQIDHLEGMKTMNALASVLGGDRSGLPICIREPADYGANFSTVSRISSHMSSS